MRKGFIPSGPLGKWIVLSIKVRCPQCGREFESFGSKAEEYLAASWITCLCGFEGTYIEP